MGLLWHHAWDHCNALNIIESAQLFPNPIRFYKLCKLFKSCDKKAQLIPSNRWVVSHRAARICGNVRAREEKAPPVVWKKTMHTMQQLISYPISSIFDCSLCAYGTSFLQQDLNSMYGVTHPSYAS